MSTVAPAPPTPAERVPPVGQGPTPDERPRGLRRFAAPGLGVFPLISLMLINFFDTFDSATFTVLTPEIRDAFGLSNQAVTGIVIANLGLSTFLVLPIGFFADRLPRRAIVIVSALAAATFSFSTGLVGVVWALVLVRFGNGVGRLVNEPVHTSLLADYYPPEQRGEAFSMHRAVDPLSLILAPSLAGFVASFLDWRWAFMLMSLPAAVAALVAFRLPEPLRGQREDAEAAEEAAKQPPISFARAYRLLKNVKTVKRVWLASFFAGAGIGPLTPVFGLYFNDVWDLSARQRGYITSFGSLAAFTGLLIIGPVTSRLMRRGPAHAQLLAGLIMAVSSSFLLVLAAARELWLAIAAFPFVVTGVSIYIIPALAVATTVIPPRVRSQGLAYPPLFLTFGAILFFPLSGISDTYGHRWTLFAFSPLLILAGLAFASAYRFVNADARRATAVLTAEAELHRQAQEAAHRSLLLGRGLDVAYGTVPVLRGVDFDVREGEILALLGTNGAGKSTLLRAISGLVTPDAGVVFFDGYDITFHEPEEAHRLGIVMSPGGRAMFPEMTVAECLLAASWSVRDDPDEVRRRVDEVTAMFPRLRERLHQRAGTMSGGEQQMVALAQAMMSRPRLLMIDELTLGLAPKVVGELLDAVRAINASGVTVVLVEQSVNVALTLADRAYFMERGQIRFEGPTTALLERDDLLRSVFLAKATES